MNRGMNYLAGNDSCRHQGPLRWFGIATALAAAAFTLMALPDMVRYLRMKRM